MVVAHVNHGIREDSAEDARFVRHKAMSHNIVYEEAVLTLGKGASEEEARRQRYNFLRHIRRKYNADAILTAHHKDDVIETAIINILRGTGWRGLSSLRSTQEIVRPFLHMSKAEIQKYAAAHHLQWHHDSTNDDVRYLRNHVRQELLPRMSQQAKKKLHLYIVRQNELTEQIDSEVAAWLAANAHLTDSTISLPRYQCIMLPDHVAHEILRNALRHISGKAMTIPQVKRALLFVKVAKVQRTFPINAGWQLRVLPRQVIVERRSDVVS